MRYFKCFLLAILLLVLSSPSILADSDPKVEKPWYLTSPKKTVGELILYRGKEEQELSITIFRYANKDHYYLIQISRNSVDSKFMADNSAIGGWLDIPVPLIIIKYIRKRHTITYIGSDNNWDYFTLLLE